MGEIVSVQRHLVESQGLHPEATGELTGLLWDLTLAFKMISRAVTKADASICWASTGRSTLRETGAWSAG
jgi:fructose-1,6-bisphosphatase I